MSIVESRWVVKNILICWVSGDRQLVTLVSNWHSVVTVNELLGQLGAPFQGELHDAQEEGRVFDTAQPINVVY